MMGRLKERNKMTFAGRNVRPARFGAMAQAGGRMTGAGGLATEAGGRTTDALDAGDRDERPALSPAARRALAEAETRRAEAERREAERAKEIGRNGLDPARYGDWEKNGIASDF
jgi:hypothetical protein